MIVWIPDNSCVFFSFPTVLICWNRIGCLSLGVGHGLAQSIWWWGHCPARNERQVPTPVVGKSLGRYSHHLGDQNSHPVSHISANSCLTVPIWSYILFWGQGSPSQGYSWPKNAHWKMHIWFKSPSNHHQISIKSPSNHHRITNKSPWNRH